MVTVVILKWWKINQIRFPILTRMALIFWQLIHKAFYPGLTAGSLRNS
jgi:hypothetical protein